MINKARMQKNTIKDRKMAMILGIFTEKIWICLIAVVKGLKIVASIREMTK